MNKLLPALAILLACSTSSFAVKPVNSTFTGVAIKGYDPVAYHLEKKAVKGSKSHEYRWKDATWRFASADHLAKFKAAPDTYAPQYGGWCAYAVSQNNTAGIDPEQFTLLNGKLYLNYSRKIQEKWKKDRDAYIKQADKNWPLLLGK